MSDDNKGRSLETTKEQILTELKESTKLEGADFDKFVQAADGLVVNIKNLRREAEKQRFEIVDLKEQFNTKATEFEAQKTTLTTSKDAEIAAIQKQLNDKIAEFEPIKDKAAKFETYDAEKRKAIKEVLKDKWLASFDTMPLLDLERLFNTILPDSKLIDSDNGKGKKQPDKDILTMEEIKAIPQAQLMADKALLDKVNKSMAHHKNQK